MSSDERRPVYEVGDVVYGTDPFKGDGAGRPWVVVSNHEGRPFEGDQYVALTLTTQSWLDDLIELSEGDWLRGGTPEQSRIVPWGVQSLDAADIEFWQGRLDRAVLAEAVDALVTELSVRE